MKQILQKLAFSLLLVSLTVTLTTAQSPVIGKATINTDMVITLDKSGPLVADYSFDISGMGLRNKEAAERYFSLGRDNLVSYTVNYDTKTATVHLMLDLTQPRGWDVDQYNEYFVKVSERYRSNMTVVNE
ncbi:MAG: hypothetical protein ACHQFW_00425 [Chitinophagales bacterium]